MPNSRHTYSFPTRIEYGPGAVKDLPDIVKQSRLHRGLLVTDKGVEEIGTPEMVRDYFKSAGIELVTYNDVRSNPTDDNVYDGTAIYKNSKCDFIVSLGGGSPIDVGKTIKCMVTHDEPLEKYDDSKGGSDFIINNMPQFYAIPTTAGTGSEVGRSSVITIKSTRKKTIIFSPFLMPTVAVLDPELTFSLPPKLTAATGVDAFVHNLEAYLTDSFHPIADGIAKEGVYLCFYYLPIALDDGVNINARGSMLMASAMGAIAFQKGLGINHSIAHALGVYHDTHHGLANAAILIEVLKYNLPGSRVKAKLASLGPLFKTEHDADAVINKIEQWLISLNMPTNLTEFKINKDQIQELENYALDDPCCTLNPRKVERGDIVEIIEKLI